MDVSWEIRGLIGSIRIDVFDPRKLVLRHLLCKAHASSLEALYQISSGLKTVSRLGQRFLQVIYKHPSKGLGEWLKQASERHIQEFHRFALGSLKEDDAVHA